MNYLIRSQAEKELYHHGVLGMRWGIRRYQNKNGSLTAKGKARLKKQLTKDVEESKNYQIEARQNLLDWYNNFYQETLYESGLGERDYIDWLVNEKKYTLMLNDVEKGTIKKGRDFVYDKGDIKLTSEYYKRAQSKVLKDKEIKKLRKIEERKNNAMNDVGNIFDKEFLYNEEWINAFDLNNVPARK